MKTKLNSYDLDFNLAISLGLLKDYTPIGVYEEVEKKTPYESGWHKSKEAIYNNYLSERDRCKQYFAEFFSNREILSNIMYKKDARYLPQYNKVDYLFSDNNGDSLLSGLSFHPHGMAHDSKEACLRMATHPIAEKIMHDVNVNNIDPVQAIYDRLGHGELYDILENTFDIRNGGSFFAGELKKYSESPF